MNLDIKMLQGAGSLRFGMQVDEVRRELGESFKSFKRTPNSAFPCDYFADDGVFAYYKLPGVLEALEFSEPSNPLLDGEPLIGVTAEKVKALLEYRDAALEIEADGFISHSLGISIYAPGWAEDDTQVVESVVVFEEGYY